MLDKIRVYMSSHGSVIYIYIMLTTLRLHKCGGCVITPAGRKTLTEALRIQPTAIIPRVRRALFDVSLVEPSLIYLW